MKLMKLMKRIAVIMMVLLIVGIVAATPYPARLLARLWDKHPAVAVCEPVALGVLLVLAIAYTVSGTYSPFLYFNF